jgi:hemerythrin
MKLARGLQPRGGMLPETHAQSVRRALDTALAKHHELLALTRAIETAVESRIHGAPGDVGDRLETLAERVSGNPRGEDQRLVYEVIPARHPDLEDEATSCRAQRGELAISLHDLAAAARTASDVGLASELGLEIRETVARLRRHEAAEGRILRTALAASVDATEPLGRNLEVDHRFLRQMLAWLEHAGDGAALVALLRDLAAYLEVHFSAEEAPGGLYAALEERSGAAAAEMKKQHTALLDRIRGLSRAIAPRFERISPEQANELHALVAMLREHEAAEDSAFQDLLERDLGGAD